MTLDFNINEIHLVAKQVLKALKHKTVLFYGDMGAGKTTLIHSLVNVLGGKDDVSSPTFSLVNEYKVTNDIVYHFDFYRVNNEEEALDIGIEDYFYSKHWNFIEWPENIKKMLPNKVDILKLEILKNNKRHLNLNTFKQ